LLVEDSLGTYGMKMFYDGGTNDLQVFGKSGATLYGPHLSIERTTGFTGIGTSSPAAALDVVKGGSATGGLPGKYFTTIRTRNEDAARDSAMSIDASLDKEAILYFAEDGDAKWSFASDPPSGFLSYGSFALRSHPSLLGDSEHVFCISRSIFGNPYNMSMNGRIYPSADAFSSFTLGLSNARWYSIYLANAPIVTSDERAKSNIRPLDRGLAEILALQPKRYDLSLPDELKTDQIGLIAQELQKVIPEVVVEPENPEELLGVQYSAMVPVLVKAIQDQQALIVDHEQRLADQEARLDRLEALLLGASEN
jgi:hypothetical protein